MLRVNMFPIPLVHVTTGCLCKQYDFLGYEFQFLIVLHILNYHWGCIYKTNDQKFYGENEPVCLYSIVSIATDKRGYPHNIFLISQRKHMLWVLIRSASPRRF